MLILLMEGGASGHGQAGFCLRRAKNDRNRKVAQKVGGRQMECGWEMRTKRSLLFPQADLLLHPWPSPSYLMGGEGPWHPAGISHASSVPANLAHLLVASRQVRNIPQFCFTSLPYTHVTVLRFNFLIFLQSPPYG